MRELQDDVRDGDLATIKRFHAEGVDVTKRGIFGNTPIICMVAAGNGRILPRQWSLS
jgi:hypothetical protein